MERSEPSDNTDTTSRASVDSQEETDAYDNMFQAIENEEYDQTIGLRGGRYTTYRTGAWQGRLKRMHEIFSVVRKYDIMHGMTPVTLRRMLEELGPTFVKAGQILSMRSEILPEPFCQELSKLQANVIPMDRETVLSSLRAEYAIPIEDLFDAIDDVPLGSASIAQVHRARLITGEDVAIKIQRPHVQETMAQDIDIMRGLPATLTASSRILRYLISAPLSRSSGTPFVRKPIFSSRQGIWRSFDATMPISDTSAVLSRI